VVVTLRWRRAARPLVASAVLISAALVLLSGVVWRGETPSAGDLTRYHRPVKTMMTRLWTENGGRTPEWTPYLASGQPFRANPHAGTSHPSVLLFRLLPFNTAFLIWVLLPLPIGAAGMFLLLRELGRSRDTGLLMGGAWACGGFALSTVAMPPVAWTAMLAPGAAALVIRSTSSPSPANLVFAASGLALCVAGGAPVSIVAAGVVVVAAVVDRRLSATPRDATRISAGATICQLAVVGALAAALAAPVLVPAVSLTQRSIRAVHDRTENPDMWSLPPLRLLEPWLPTVAGSSANERWSWTDRMYAGQLGVPLVASIYPGILVTALALAAAFSRRRSTLPWLIAAAFGAIASLGTVTPLWGAVLSRLPLVGGVRYPEKWSVLPAVAAIVLAASALDAVRKGDGGARRLVSIWLLVTALLGIGLAIVVKFGGPVGGMMVESREPAQASEFIQSAMFSAVVALGSWVAWRLTQRVGWRWGVLVVAAAIAADLCISGRSIVSTQSPEEMDRVPACLAPLVESGGSERLFDLASWQPRCRAYHPALQPRPVQWGIPIALNYSYDLTQLEDSARAVQEVAGIGASRPDLLPQELARRSITAVLTCPADSAARQQPLLVPVQLPNPLITCVDHVDTADSDRGWADRVRALNPDERRHTAIVNDAVVRPTVLAAPCQVGAVEMSPDRWQFEVSATGPGASFIAINQTWDKFWTARVDSRPVAIQRCEINLSGLWVEPGTHFVELEYRDPTVAAGNSIGLAGLVLCAAIVAAGRRFRNHRDRSPTNTS
jgi:hypothetical protein